MTTIILTIIGILLAAAAALMVIFYGGDAFNAGSIGAQANTYQNAGTNVVAAVQLAKADNFAYTDVTSLLGDYLQEAPALPVGSAGELDVTVANDEFYSAQVVSNTAANEAAVCARINENLRNGLVATAATRSTSAKMGCFTDATNGATFFANL